MLERVFKYLLTAAVLVIALSGIAAGVLSGWVHSRGGIEAVVADYIDSNFDQFEAEFAHLDWQVQLAEPALAIKAEDISLTFRGQTVTVPHIQLIYTLSSVMSGVPTAVLVDTKRLTFVRSQQGWDVSETLSWLSDPSAAGQNGPGLQQGWKLWPAGLMRLQIRAETLEIKSAEGAWEDIVFSNLNLSAMPEAGVFARGNVELVARIFQPVNSGEIRPGATVSATVNLFSGLTEFSVDTQNLNTDFLSVLFNRYDGLKRTRMGRVTSSMSGAFDQEGLQILSGTVSARDGVLDLALLSEDRAAFSQTKLSFDYSAADNLLMISDADMTFKSGQAFSASARITGVTEQRTTLSGQLLASDLALGDLLRQWPEKKAAVLRDFITAHSSGGHLRTAILQLTASLDQEQDRFDIASLGLSGEVTNLRLAYSDNQYQSIVGTLGGDFEFTVGAEGRIDTARGSLSLRDGFASINGYEEAVKIPKMDAVIRYSPDEMLLQNLFVDFADKGQILAHAKRRRESETFRTELNLSWPQLDMELTRHAWPAGLAAKTINWINEHLKYGTSREGKFSVSFVETGGKLKAEQLSGHIPFTGMRFRLFPDLVPVDGVNGQLDFSDNQMRASFDTGRTKQLVNEQAEVFFGPLLNAVNGRKLNFKMRAGGDIAEVLEIIDHHRINQLRPSGLHRFDITGQTRFQLSFDGFKPRDGVPLALSNVRVEGTLSEARIAGLPLEQTLEAGALVVKSDNSRIQISGSGRLSGIESSLSYQQLKEKADFDLQLKLENSEALTAFLSRRFDWPLSGAAAARLAVSGNRNSNDFTVNLRADVTDMALSYNKFDWSKLEGESGAVNAQLVFENNRVTRVEAIDIETDRLRARGRLTLDDMGVPSFGLLEDIILPGTDLTSVLFERESKKLRFTAEGKRLNLQPLRRDNSVKEGLEISFDVTAEEIAAGPKVSFSGALKGTTQPDGNGNASLQGSLLVAGAPLLTESTLNISFGPAGEYLSGAGLIGGAEVNLDFSPLDEARARLHITSENAGRVLLGLDITDAVRGGALEMVTTFADDSFERYKTEMNLSDFNVVEAPRAVRLFSVLSLAGLYGLVEGEGTRFARGQAVIESQGSRHNLLQARAAGGAVGVALVGSVDKKKNSLDISGNLVPANQLSGLIGKVPLVGQILTGIDKTGLFATQFSMKGSLDDPDVDINPLSIAPGVLRDIFSPDWLGSEGRRIFSTQ